MSKLSNNGTLTSVVNVIQMIETPTAGEKGKQRPYVGPGRSATSHPGSTSPGPLPVSVRHLGGGVKKSLSKERLKWCGGRDRGTGRGESRSFRVPVYWGSRFQCPLGRGRRESARVGVSGLDPSPGSTGSTSRRRGVVKERSSRKFWGQDVGSRRGDEETRVRGL